MPSAGHPVPLLGLPRSHQPESTTAAINVRDLMTRDYIIADDSMEGRDTGKPGGVKSTNYIAAELKRLGVQPAGEHGSYFQTVPFINRAFDSSSALTVDGRTFRQFVDFKMLPRLGLQVFLGGQPFGGSFRGEGVATVWGGRIGQGALIDPAQVRGKVVVFGATSTTFFRTDNLRNYAEAKAIIVDLGSVPMPNVAIRNPFYNDTTLLALPIVVATGPVAAQIFGADLATLPNGTAGKPLSGHFGYIDTPTAAPTRNVVGIIPGSDPKLKKQYVAIGAHSDHVGFDPAGALDHDSIRIFNAQLRPRGADDPDPTRRVTPEQWARVNASLDSIRKLRPVRRDSIDNGADDDGSGTVMALEIAEAFALAKVKPKRSLLFVWHAAEEMGLYGAEYFGDHPTVPRDSIVTQVNMDQMGRGGPEDAPPGGENAMVLIGTRRLSSELGDLAEAVNNRPGNGFKLDYTFDAPNEPSQGYCRSDHYMYARWGIPVLFFVSAVWYIDYHMVSDEPQYLHYPRMAKVGNYIHDVVGEVANLDHRPRIDQPKPEPNGICRQ